MAQKALPGLSSAGSDRHNGMTKEQLYELEQYEKIILLRDAILADTHPVIKVSKELLASVQKTARSKEHETSGGVLLNAPSVVSGHAEFLTSGASGLALPGPPDSAPQHRAPEINPIFLEKSDHLVKAELRLQRQRLERALKDEADQRRPAKQSPGDLSIELDIADILSQALTLVPVAAAPKPAVPVATANTDDRSDSFDNNTFYSSQHDTPDLQSSPSRRNAPIEQTTNAAGPDASDEAIDDLYEPEMLDELPHPAVSASDLLAQAVASSAAAPPPAAHRPMAVVPGLNNYPVQNSASSWGSHHAVTVPNSSNTRILHQRADPLPARETEVSAPPIPSDIYAQARPPSPFIQDLPPTAIQPPHHAAFPGDSSASNSGVPTAVGTPAQVAALRHDPTSAESPDSSPQGGRVPERKKSKKKKRKAERQAAEAEAVYIKPEPRSLSPVAAPSYIRPNKRARHAHRQAQAPGAAVPHTSGLAPGYDGSEHAAAAPASRHAGHPPHVSASGEHIYAAHARAAPHPLRHGSTAHPGARRYSGGYVDAHGRVAPHSGYGAYAPQPYPIHEPPEATYEYVETAKSYPRAVSQQYPYEGSRTSLRPEPSPYAGVPAPQTQRIYVDSTGREYLEPPRRPVVRQSVAPAGYFREPDVVYERVPPRAVSRYAEPGHHVDGGPPYASATPAYPPARRVVTQPEYVPQPYGESYHRRSMMPPDAHLTDPTAQEYAARAASVRPPPPPPPGPYTSSRDYGGGPESRREAMSGGFGAAQPPPQPYDWEYGPGAGPHPGGYYVASAGGTEEMAYVEQPY